MQVQKYPPQKLRVVGLGDSCDCLGIQSVMDMAVDQLDNCRRIVPRRGIYGQTNQQPNSGSQYSQRLLHRWILQVGPQSRAPSYSRAGTFSTAQSD